MQDSKHIYRRKVDLDSGDSLALIAREIRPGSRVLELGPATGYFSEYLVNELGCTVDGVELDPGMAAEARRFHGKLVVADIEEIDVRAEFESGAYDYIVCADILEHLRWPGRLLHRLSGLLAKDGVLVASVPNIAYGGVILGLLSGEFAYREEGLLDYTHLRFFTRRTFSRLLRESGFQVQRTERVRLPFAESEFGEMLRKMWSPVKYWVLRRPDSDVYQYIFLATR